MNSILALIVVPLVLGFVLFFFKNSKVAQIANLVGHFVWAYFLFVAFKQMGAPEGVTWTWNWLPKYGSSLALLLDGANFPLIALNVLLSALLGFFALGKPSLNAAYLGLFSILNAAAVGSLLAVDAIAFYLFWEFMLIPMYFLIGRWGSKNRVYAALKFFAFTMAGSLLMLVAIVALYQSTGSTSWTVWRDSLAAAAPATLWGLHGLCFLAFLVAFAVKIPVWPLHTWLPDAHTEAPTGASVILAGVLLKLGVFGIYRWGLLLFPTLVPLVAPVMLSLGVIGIVLGSFAAWKQTDIKRIIAYSSVAHLGFMVLGLFSASPEALSGAFFQNIAHGLSTGALFLIFGIIYERTHTRDIAEYGGFAQQNAWLATFFVTASMASIGLPGLPGFVGEFLIMTGTFYKFPVYSLIAMSGVLLGAIYMLSLLRRMVFGEIGPALREHAVHLSWNEWVSVIPLMILMLVLGMQPQILLSIMAPVLEGVK